MIKDFFARLRNELAKLWKQNSSPHSVAVGFAIGTFIAVLPTPGFGVLMALLMVFLFRSMNKISIFVALVFWNPITLIPVYILSFRVGDLLLGGISGGNFDVSFFSSLLHFSRNYLVGNFVLAIIISAVCYLVVRIAVARAQSGK